MFGRPEGLSFSPSTGREFVTADNVLFLEGSFQLKSLVWKLMDFCNQSVKKGNLQQKYHQFSDSELRHVCTESLCSIICQSFMLLHHSYYTLCVCVYSVAWLV